MLKLVPQPTKIEKLSEKEFLFEHFSLGNNSLNREAVKDFIQFCSFTESKEENIIFKTDKSCVTIQNTAYAVLCLMSADIFSALTMLRKL